MTQSFFVSTFPTKNTQTQLIRPELPNFNVVPSCTCISFGFSEGPQKAKHQQNQFETEIESFQTGQQIKCFDSEAFDGTEILLPSDKTEVKNLFKEILSEIAGLLGTRIPLNSDVDGIALKFLWPMCVFSTPCFDLCVSAAK